MKLKKTVRSTSKRPNIYTALWTWISSREVNFIITILALGIALYQLDQSNDQLKASTAQLELTNVQLNASNYIIQLAQQQLNNTEYQIESPMLNITESITVNDTARDSGSSRETLLITIRNDAKMKETGAIQFYRLEMNEHTPFWILPSLKPGQNTSINLSINVNNFFYQPKMTETGIVVWPITTARYVAEKTSISYKITCDNCNAQGYVRRIPPIQTNENILRIKLVFGNHTIKPIFNSTAIANYSWTTYNIADLGK